MAGLDQTRVAEIIAPDDRGPARRGSGYRVASGAVLTAAHVVADATRVRVRFNADLPGEWSVPARVEISDPAADVAVLSIVPRVPGEEVIPALFGAVGPDRAEPLDCTAVGFPRFKLRDDPGESPQAPLSRYRDSHQANGTIAPLGNWRERTLEILVPAPAPDPDPGHSPWEGMSGAAVWCKGRIIGVVSKHHPGDGLGNLAAARIERLYRTLDAGALVLARELAGLPVQRDQLVDVSDPAYAGEMECPYRGLQPFTAEDARLFFGRREVVTHLLGTLAKQPFVALMGASGSGKSSVLSAGLVPAASTGEGGGSGYHCARITPTADPVRQLAGAVEEWAGLRPDELRGDTAVRVAEVLASRPPRHTPLMLVVDQMEELHTLCADEQARRAFIRGLLALIGAESTRNRVVIGVRTDFYAECADDPDLGPVMDDRQFILRPMGKPELRSIIEKPAALTGLRVDPRLTEMLLADIGDEPGKLPLLSHALLATFERRQGPQLTVEDYIAVGRVQGALNKTADEAYDSLDAGQRDIARAIFIRCTAGDGTIPDTRRPVRRADLDPETFPGVDAVLNRLAAARLVTLTDERTGETSQQIVEVAHEALIRSWGRLEGWLDAYRRYRPVHQDLITAAVKWDLSGRAPGWLHQGANLEAARTLQASDSPVRLTRTEQDFLNASQAQAKRRSHLLRLLVSGVAMTLVAAIIAAVTAVSQNGQKNEQHSVAVGRQVLQEASAVSSADPGLARQLLVAAYRVAPTDQAQGALLGSQEIPRQYDFRGPVWAAAYSPRAPVLAVGSEQGITLMNPASGSIICDIPGSAGYASALAFSPQGNVLAAGGRDGDVRLWDISNPAHPALTGTTPRFHDATISVLGFASSGVLAVALGNNAVGLLNVSDPAAPVLLAALPGYATATIASMALSPDGQLLAAGGPNNTVRLWNITRPAHPVRIAAMAGPAPDVDALAFSPTGHLLAAGGWLNSTVSMWDVTDPRHPQPRPGLASGAMDGPALAFSPDGNTLAVAAGHSVQVWDVADPLHPAEAATLAGHDGTVNAVAFSPDSQALATGSSDNTLTVSDIADAGNPAPMTEIRASAYAPAVFSPSGRYMVAGNPPVLWDVSSPASPVQLATFPAGTVKADGQQIAFSPDGQTVAIDGSDGTIRIWGLADPRSPNLITRLSAQSGALTFIGSHILADATLGGIRRWDLSVPAHPVALTSISVPSALSQPPSLAGSGALLDLTEPADAQAIDSLAEHRKAASLLALSPDGQTLAAVGAGQVVTLWNVSKSPATQLATLSAASAAIPSQAAFSPDGKVLAFASPQGMSLWDVSNPAGPVLITTLTSNSPFLAATFSPAGDLLATTGQDGTVDLWDMSMPRIIGRLCSGTGAPITRAQWNHYLPGIPYTVPCPAHSIGTAEGTTLVTVSPPALP